MASEPPRSTQRAPLSCSQCYKRKIRCDKKSPCKSCIARGIALECKRETVQVRGRIYAGSNDQSDRSYSDLVQENIRLRALIAGSQQQRHDTEVSEANSDICQLSESRVAQAERLLFNRIAQTSKPRSVKQYSNVLIPSKSVSDGVVAYGLQRTFWLHFALFIPEFQQEYGDFWARYSEDQSYEHTHPFWLAIYFSVLASALLFMGDEQVACLGSNVKRTDLLQNWYESALFFLDTGDFTQRSDTRVVKSIAILGTLFTCMGDNARYKALWSVALHQAQEIGMHQESLNQGETYSQQQTRRRLWWTLVVCEWLPVPLHIPFVNDFDFDCKVPDEVDDEELANVGGGSRLARSRPRGIRYHIAMIQIARISYQLHYRLRLKGWKRAELTRSVFAADEELADLINDLPAYLQFSEAPTESTRKRDELYIWIPWQRRSLTQVLLYYRMAIARTLQEHWLEGSLASARTRAICKSSAQALIYSTTEELLDASKLRPW
ncbi:fungal-specific transcription factor domain-containing protein [Thelonectria olida]|uniref:Fungal-specific transcription factor domain-containing protein n=1 Tax=Thelonectria olida TaxID=1576542 RepID=A0A9P8VRI7_9HYPO|nr:fungal-specific transcription factor domain-containing protein [Thelonectria olida]